MTRESKEDSTNKQSYVIGLTFPESKLLREHLVYLLKESFRITDETMEKTFKKYQQKQQEDTPVVVEVEDEDDLW